MAVSPAVQPTDFASLVREHQVGVWRYLRALGCTPDLADDLCQDVFLALLHAGFEPVHPRATVSYLRKTARSVWRRARQQRVAEAGISLEGPGAAVAFDAAWTALHGTDDSGEPARAALRQCLDELTDRAREALRRQYAEQQSGEDIARAIGVSHGALRVMLHRARQALRTCIEQKAATS